MTVHPHGRGERVGDIRDQDFVGGSSPRAWGTPSRPRSRTPWPRFIPTGVGNALVGVFVRSSDSVHPHGRGERLWAYGIRPVYAGSSPRAWGTQRINRRLDRLARFIPTGVGNAVYDRKIFREPPVHPHGRGEREEVFRFGSSTSGSSPRAWGTHLRPPLPPAQLRFIPTGVGNAIATYSRFRKKAVHPHGRGERS